MPFIIFSALQDATIIMTGVIVLTLLALLYLALRKTVKENHILNKELHDLKADTEEKLSRYEKIREGISEFAVDNYELACDLKEKNQALNKENETLQQRCTTLANEVDAIKKSGDFSRKVMRMAIHELKNTLNIIINTVDNPGIPGNLSARIKKASYEMNALILNLLETGKVEEISINKEEFDLTPVVGKIYSKYAAICSNYSVELINYVSHPCFVSGDKILIERVLNNLLSNACKFTPPLGKICISATSTAENLVRIEVRDTGTGIRNEFVGKTFHEYSQDNSRAFVNSSPTGIGLAFSRSVIEAHGGKMGIITKEEEGTRVWFTLQKTEESQYSSDAMLLESNNRKAVLSKNDLSLIGHEFELLRKTHIHEISEILRILKSPAFNTNENLREVKKMLENAAFSSDEKMFRKLVDPIK